MPEKKDWHIWKAKGSSFILPTTERPHDHIDPTEPAECRATIYSVTEEVADKVLATLTDRKCSNCKGSGSYLADPQDTEKSPCYQCKGTGKWFR